MTFEEKMKLNSQYGKSINCVVNGISQSVHLKDILRFININKPRKDFYVAYIRTNQPVAYYWLLSVDKINMRIPDETPEIDKLLLPLLKRED